MVAEKSEKSRAITYAAVSAALGTIMLTAGAYTGIGEFFWYFAAGVCVMITFPLKSLTTCFLSFVVCSLLSLLTTGFTCDIPFAVSRFFRCLSGVFVY